MGERDSRTFEIIGAAMEVHKELGCGFLEPVYQEALAIELGQRGIPYRREVELPIDYKGVTIDSTYRADFVCFDTVLLELKATRETGVVEEAQVINYLKAGRLAVGLLLNFGRASLQYRRFANTEG